MKKIVSGDCPYMGKINIETMKNFDVEAVNEHMNHLYSDLLNS